MELQAIHARDLARTKADAAAAAAAAAAADAEARLRIGEAKLEAEENKLLFLKAAHRWRFRRDLKINFAYVVLSHPVSLQLWTLVRLT